jgi:hypothetical protein
METARCHVWEPNCRPWSPSGGSLGGGEIADWDLRPAMGITEWPNGCDWRKRSQLEIRRTISKTVLAASVMWR